MQTQLYKVGDKVRHSSLSPYRFGTGVIIECYEMAGYWYYVINRRTYRQKDLKK